MSDAKSVKELREKTGAGMLDCRNALVESNGDMQKAIDVLREKGLSLVKKKGGRIASEGVVGSYIHGNGRIGVLVEVNSETDFVARNEEFLAFVKDIAMQIAATNPKYLKRDEISSEDIEKEKNILRVQALNEGKPEKVVEKMVEGRIDKFYKEVCLMDQSFVKDPDKTITDLLNEKIAKIGENINIRRFVRYEMGEGLEKKKNDFVSEVASQIKG